MWQKRLSLGTYFNIGVFVHWSFGLLVGYLLILSAPMGIDRVLFNLGLLAAVYLCVTLHEYGHALAAARYGIKTVDITLYPIGGVARLEKIPRKPRQELIIAVAGPAVNVVLVFAISFLMGLFVKLPIAPETAWDQANDANSPLMLALNDTTAFAFAFNLLAVNMIMILFNLIPAFPMDGGRVLRSVLAMNMDYRRATNLAARIGFFLACLLGAYAITQGLFILAIIAVFIAFAGQNEARQVGFTDAIVGLRVSDVMMREPPSMRESTQGHELAQQVARMPLAQFPVVDHHERVVGMLSLDAIAQAIATAKTLANATNNNTALDNPSSPADPQAPHSGRTADQSTEEHTPFSPTDRPVSRVEIPSVGELVDRKAVILAPDDLLSDVLAGAQAKQAVFAVTNYYRQLVGVIDMSSLTARIAILKQLDP